MPRYERAQLAVKGVIFRAGRVLLLHRRHDLPLLPGLWDLPGGTVEVGDGLEDCLVREVREETGFSARVVRPIHTWITRVRFVSGRKSGRKLTAAIVCYECSSARANRAPRLDPQEHTEYAWVAPAELADYPLPPGMREAVTRAVGYRAGSGRRLR